MIKYFYDAYKRYIGSADVKDGDISANATSVAPPDSELEGNNVYVFIDSSETWEARENVLKKLYWLPDGTETKVEDLQNPLPPNALFIPPPSPAFTSHDGKNWIADIGIAKTEKMSELNKSFLSASEAAINGFTQPERETWFALVSEAKSFDANNIDATPFIKAFCNESGDDPQTLVDDVISRNLNYGQNMGRINGRNSKLRKQILNASDISVLNDIDIDFDFGENNA